MRKLAALAHVATLAVMASSAHAVEHCYDFSLMPVGTVYRLGDVHVGNLLQVVMRDFFVDGVAVAQSDANRVSVNNTALALGAAPEIHTYLLNAQIIPNAPVSKVTMQIAQNVGASGNAKANLGVNGELREFSGPLSLADGKKMGKPGMGEVEVSVSLTPDGGDSYWHRGTLTLTALSGLIEKVTIGAQGGNIDNACFEWP